MNDVIEKRGPGQGRDSNVVLILLNVNCSGLKINLRSIGPWFVFTARAASYRRRRDRPRRMLSSKSGPRRRHQ